jgi:SPW repeat
MDEWTSAKLCDVVNLSLGMILFFSPWLFGLAAGAQWQTASTVGNFIAVLSVAALAAFAVWEEWLNLIAGLWLIVSPWLLDFQDSHAMTIDVAIGTIVAVLAACEVWLTRGRPAARDDNRLNVPNTQRPERPKWKGGRSVPLVRQSHCQRQRIEAIGSGYRIPPLDGDRRVSRVLAAALIAHGGRDRGNPDLAVALVKRGILVQWLANLAFILVGCHVGTDVFHRNPVSHFS